MYKHRMRFRVEYGKARQLVEWTDAMNALAADKGWAKGTMWNLTFGPINIFELEWNYESLATFEREQKAQYGDESFMNLFRSANEFVVEGESETELLETIGALA